jgi:GSCFA family
LKQWATWAFGKAGVPDEIWEEDGRYFDPFRPRIEPDGFASPEELLKCREQTLEAFRRSVVDANFFVFTLGLTESWRNERGGYEYPMCPGTASGKFLADEHSFVNQSFSQIRQDLVQAFRLMREFNPTLRFILTVSPVPLTATMSGRHVLVATTASKSILRAVADSFQSVNRNVDYFPSYEIISNPVFRGTYYEPNQRDVNPYGVNLVMDTFFRCIYDKFGQPPKMKANRVEPGEVVADLVCEEELLAAFAK